MTASTSRANGAVKICTSQPPIENEPNSATDSVAVSVLFPSIKSFPADQTGQVALIGNVEKHRQDAEQSGDDEQMPDVELIGQCQDRNQEQHGRSSQIGADHHRAAFAAVDPGAGQQADEESGQQRGDTERGHIERRGVELDDRQKGDGNPADERAEHGNALPEPELLKIGIAPNRNRLRHTVNMVLLRSVRERIIHHDIEIRWGAMREIAPSDLDAR